MAISANTVVEIRTGGADTNGGGFVTGSGGTDYSQQNSKNTTGSDISTSDAVGAGSTTITSLTANFSTGIVGNIIYLQGGTGSLAASWYQVISRSSATSIVVDRSVAVGTGITMNIGGALGSIGILSSFGFLAMNAFIQAGTFSVSSATTNTSNGGFSIATTGNLVGYTSNRVLGNTDVGPIFNFTVGSVVFMIFRGTVYNITINGNGQTSAAYSGTGDQSNYVLCTIKGINVAALGSGTLMRCIITANSAAIVVSKAFGCEAFSNTATPYNGTVYVDCLSYNNTGASTDGFELLAQLMYAINCSSYGNGANGFNWGAAARVNSAINCHAENNTGHGFNLSAVNGTVLMMNCSAYNNTAGAVSSNLSQNLNQGFITVTVGSVFVAAGSANFALNNTANEGALLRGAGSPALFPAGTTASFPDIGAAQHQGTAAATVASTYS